MIDLNLLHSVGKAVSYWGIDPGANGAVARITLFPSSAPTFSTHPLGRIKPPTGETRVTGRPTTTLATGGMIEIGFAYPEDEVFIERVQAMPAQGRKQGAASSFTFGMNVGILWGGLEKSRIPMDHVHLVCPNSWKAFFSLSGRPKHESAVFIQKHLYAHCPMLVQRITDMGEGLKDTSPIIGEVDALLLALYGLMKTHFPKAKKLEQIV